MFYLKAIYVYMCMEICAYVGIGGVGGIGSCETLGVGAGS